MKNAFFSSKTIKFYIITILILSIIGVASGMQTFEQKYYYTVYGQVEKLNLNQNYEAEETLLGFDQEAAFPSDQAMYYTTQTSPKMKQNFCVTEAVPQKQPSAFRILSFNIHNFHKICDLGQGELRKNPHFALNEIGRFSPNIVLLQEFVPYAKTMEEAKNHLGSTASQITVNFSHFDIELQKKGFTESVKVNDFEKKGWGIFMGKAIYTSKNTILNVSNNNLNDDEADDRGYLRILFTYPGSKEQILLYNVHLTFELGCLATDLEKKEITQLVTAIENDTKKFSTNYVIIMGDFNKDPYKKSPDSEEKASAFDALQKKFTLLNDYTKSNFNQYSEYDFPSGYPGDTNDLVWVSNEFLNKFEIKNPKSTDGSNKWKIVVKSDASDHWPIYLDFSIKAPQAPQKTQEEVEVGKFDPVNSSFSAGLALLKTIESEIKKGNASLNNARAILQAKILAGSYLRIIGNPASVMPDSFEYTKDDEESGKRFKVALTGFKMSDEVSEQKALGTLKQYLTPADFATFTTDKKLFKLKLIFSPFLSKIDLAAESIDEVKQCIAIKNDNHKYYYNPKTQEIQEKDDYFYYVLGKKKTDTLANIDKAYKILSQQYHTDKIKGVTEALELIPQLQTPKKSLESKIDKIIKEITNAHDMIFSKVAYVKPTPPQQTKSFFDNLKDNFDKDFQKFTSDVESLKKQQEQTAQEAIKQFEESTSKDKSFEEILIALENKFEFVHKPENIKIYMPVFEAGLRNLHIKYTGIKDIKMLERQKALYEKCKNSQKAFSSYWPKPGDLTLHWGIFISQVGAKINSLAHPEQKDEFKIKLTELKTNLSTLKTKLDTLSDKLNKLKSKLQTPQEEKKLNYKQMANALFFAAAGDALGRITEFTYSKAKILKLGKHKTGIHWFDDIPSVEQTYIFTDDTVMAHVVFEELEKEYANPSQAVDNMAMRFAALFGDQKYVIDPLFNEREHGNTNTASCTEILNLPKGKIWKDRKKIDFSANPTKERGCGSVMRAWPIGFFYSDNIPLAIQVADQQSQITHRNPSARAACAAIAAGFGTICQTQNPSQVAEAMIQAAENYKVEELIVKPEAKPFTENKEQNKQLISQDKMLTCDMLRYAQWAANQPFSPDDILGIENETHNHNRTSTGALLGWIADEAVSAALYVFLRHPNDPQAALYEAVNTPGDSDSIATLAGAFSGYLYKGDAFTLPHAMELERAKWIKVIGNK